MDDSLILEVADFEHDVLTGIYSEETGRPQPLRFTIQARMKPLHRYEPDTSLEHSKNYMDLKFAASDALPEGVHFKLIEAVADHVCETLFLQDGCPTTRWLRRESSTSIGWRMSSKSCERAKMCF